MNMLRQTAAITWLNLASLRARIGTSLVICTGIAGVVAVLVTVLAMASGLRDALISAGRSDRAVILRGGAQTEALSSLPRDASVAIEAAPGIRRGTVGKLVSPEVVLGVNLPRASDGASTGATVRGITATAPEVRPEIRLVDGRMFATGRNEIVVGQAARELYGLPIGGHATFHNSDWRVVGVFESGGDVHESELFTDAEALLSAAQRSVYSAATVQLDSAAAFEPFKAALLVDPTLTVDVERETDYYAAQTRNVSGLLDVVAHAVAGIMALGAVFGALNTMYSAVSARAVEIATLRAIGFSATPVVASILVEAQLLAWLGAAFGAGAAWLLFNGAAFSSGSVFGQVALHLHVSAGLIATGIGWGAAIGLIGGALPAVQAARRSVTDALRVAA
jgi:putative ABC transport system permease protein